MTIEELEALLTQKITDLTDQIGNLQTNILAEVDRRNSGTAASITRDVAKRLAELQTPTETPTPTPPTDGSEPARLTVKALQADLDKFKAELANRDAAIAAQNRAMALNNALSSKRVLAQKVLFQALSAQYGDKLQEDGGQWFVTDSGGTQTLEAAIDGFLSSEEGKAFLPSSGINGAGSKESSATTVPPSEMSVGAMAMQALSDLG